MPTLIVNGKEVTVEQGATVMHACQQAGYEIPHFCYHQRLNIAGNCRMCLVEMEKSPKPIASCAMPAADGMVIHTNTPSVKKAREGVMEFLLINHPLDCPICDQGGECDLQDQAIAYGRGRSRYAENKRAVAEKYMGPLIKTIMTRCIHCTRCIRFGTDVAGVPDLGAVFRGEHMEIISYLDRTIDSELSGNVIDLCPVGALTSRPYAFTARPWELAKTESIDVMDALGSNIRVDSRGNEVMRILPRLHEEINEEWISDKTRFACDGLKYRRLDRPWVRKRGTLREATWQEAFRAVAGALKGVKGDQIAGIVGELNEFEGMKAMKDLLGALGSTRIESRLHGEALEPKVRAGFLFNSTIAGIGKADAILLIGSNPRDEVAVLNARIGQRVRAGKMKIFRLGPVANLTYPVEELGHDPRVLNDILAGRGKAAKALKKAKCAAVILGQGALRRSDGAAILHAARAIAGKFGMVGADWNGFNVLHTAASLPGALALGLTAKGGIAGIARDVKKGKIKVLFNLGADEIDLKPLAKAFHIYIGTHGGAGAQAADVILPGAAYTEKNGIYVNTEGRVQWGFRATFPPGDAREDWTIFRALSEVVGKKLPYGTSGDLRKALFADVEEAAEEENFLKTPWGEFGKKGAIRKAPLTYAVENIYLTNPIARASKTMAACVEARFPVPKGRTGTHG